MCLQPQPSRSTLQTHECRSFSAQQALLDSSLRFYGSKHRAAGTLTFQPAAKRLNVKLQSCLSQKLQNNCSARQQSASQRLIQRSRSGAVSVPSENDWSHVSPVFCCRNQRVLICYPIRPSAASLTLMVDTVPHVPDLVQFLPA